MHFVSDNNLTNERSMLFSEDIAQAIFSILHGKIVELNFI